MEFCRRHFGSINIAGKRRKGQGKGTAHRTSRGGMKRAEKRSVPTQVSKHETIRGMLECMPQGIA